MPDLVPYGVPTHLRLPLWSLVLLPAVFSSLACGLLLDPSAGESESGLSGEINSEPGSPELPAEGEQAFPAGEESVVLSLNFAGDRSTLVEQTASLVVPDDAFRTVGGRQALVLGEGSTVSVDSTPVFAGLGAFSVEFFVRLSEKPQGNARVALADKQAEWSFFIYGGNRIRFTAGSGATAAWCDAPEVEMWHHVALTADRDSGTLIGYLNGTPCAEGTAVQMPPSTTAPIFLGSNSPSGNEPMEGALELFRIWNRVLTPGELCTLSGGC